MIQYTGVNSTRERTVHELNLRLSLEFLYVQCNVTPLRMSDYNLFIYVQIAIGGMDSLWILNRQNEKKELRLERDAQRMGTIVWCVSFVKEGVLASGDSRGNVSLWNTINGTIITVSNQRSNEERERDILRVCMIVEYHST